MPASARDDLPGRPAAAPAVLLALWLYAVGRRRFGARAIERLCEHHAAYRWLAGGVPANHDMLSEFRRDSALAGHAADPEPDSIDRRGSDQPGRDGDRRDEDERALAQTSPAGRERLDRIEAAVAERVTTLKSELEQDAGAEERKRRACSLQAAEERARRIARAQQRLAEREQEKLARAMQKAKEEAAKSAPSVSISDPDVRQMRMADGATHTRRGTQGGDRHGLRGDDRADRPAQRRRIGRGSGGAGRTALRRGPETTACGCHGDDPGRYRKPGSRTLSRSSCSAHGRAARHDHTRGESNRRSQLKHEPDAVKGLAVADGKRRWQGGVSPAQADRARACQDEEPWVRADAGSWDRRGASVRMLHAIAHNLLHAQGL